MTTIQVSVELPVLPEEYEYTGEYCQPEKGDLYWSSNGTDSRVRRADRRHYFERLIVRKKKGDN